MSFLKSGVDALLGQVLRRLSLDDATQLTLKMIGQLDRGDFLDLGHQIGLEVDASTDADEMAERIWFALQAAMSSDTPPEHSEPTDAATEDIPWGYGQDRVTGIAVDPNRLYVYWEVTDEAIAETRSGLGAGGEKAWLNLRIYDISGRLFDGTNAHGYTDEKVDRDDRQWFMEVGKPGSDAIVEVGMKSLEGYFVKIARSGRVEFPRWGTPSTGAPEWMTVRVHSRGLDPVPSGYGVPSSLLGHAQDAPVSSGASGSDPARDSIQSGASPGETPAHGDPSREELPGTDATNVREGTPRLKRTHTTNRSYAWEERLGSWSWESGPERYPITAPGAVTERFVGGRQMHRIGERTHVVYGPWEVVIRGIDAHGEKAVLGQWETFRSWVTEQGGEETSVVQGEPGATPGSSERLFAGASGRRWGAGSEARLRGASEMWRLGASERRLRGASEYSHLAASERMIRGASERMLAGASERLLKGSSEQRFGGASERLAGGASERRFPPLPPEPEHKP